MTDIIEWCNAKFALADDYGDNDCTFHCTLPKGHAGDHMEGHSDNYRMIWLSDGADE